jgi:O-antigen/teichoic acid export membrane protein
VPVEMMAGILVMQVYVYYLVLLAQYGFFVTGPAALAGVSDDEAIRYLARSLRCKFWVLIGPVVLIFAGLLIGRWQASGWYALGFVPLLMAYALNSNWFLQARGDFWSGVMYAALGLLVSCFLMLVVKGASGAWPALAAWLAVGVLILPQSVLGLGSAWRALSSRQSTGAQASPDGAQAWLGSDLRAGLPLVVSQFMLLAGTTLGTVVVGAIADAETTAAYAATEKLFNLGATVLVGVYMAVYPNLAKMHGQSPAVYWHSVRRWMVAFAGVGFAVALVLQLWGSQLFGLYLGDDLAALVQPVWLPLSLWLGLCMAQHVLTGYLVILKRHRAALAINAAILLLTVLVGVWCTWVRPIDWVWGMLAGQLLAVAVLIGCYRRQVLGRLG